MTVKQIDTVNSIDQQLDFMGAMLLAWDIDSVEFDQLAKDGFFYMLENIRRDLKTINKK